MPDLVIITGPIAAGKNTVADELTRRLTGRGLSRDPEFHHRAHRRYRELLPTIPADLTFDSIGIEAERIAAAIANALGVGELPTSVWERARSAGPVVAVEVGGSSVQSAVLAEGRIAFVDGPVRPEGTYRWGLSAPGLVTEGRVRGAELLGWMDVEA